MNQKSALALALLLSFLVIGSASGAENTSKDLTAVKPSKQKTFGDRGKLETSLRFDGTSLHGKAQSSPSTTVSVESDKYLEDLLGARKNFDDRIAKESDRN